MREFLEDALNHRDDGYGRAQKHMQRQLPRRFYEEVGVAPVEAGFSVTLDGRPTRTPTQRPVVVPSVRLAEAMAAEWAAQGAEIDPLLMPHVRLVNAAIEGGEGARAALIEQVLAYCGNDLLFYRADSPRELVALQEKVWDDALVRLARHFSVRFEPTVGIIHKAQAPETLEKLGRALEDAGLFPAAALVLITGITGSGLLAIGLYEGLFDPETAWTAAHLDEDYQIFNWGEDFEAAERRRQRRTDFDAAVNVIGWTRQPRR